MLLARVRLDQFPLQLRDLAAQRVECAGQLLGDGAEGAEGCLQFGARCSIGSRLVAAMRWRGKQLLCLSGISPVDQSVTSRISGLPAARRQ